MIRFTLKPNNNYDKSIGMFNEDLALSVIPSPKKVLQQSKNGANLSFNFSLTVDGKFTPQKQIKMKQDLYHLLEPNWEINEFCSKIPNWLEEAWMHLETDKLNIEIAEINEDSECNLESLEEFAAEGYRSQAYYVSTTSEKIEAIAWSKHGIYYAFLTISQLIKINDGKICIPECEIWDYPDYDYRGLEDDISRGQRPTMEHFKDFIHYLSRLKLNAEGLYIEDMYKFDKFPTIGEGRNPLTKAEIKELEQFATDNFVEVQPAVEMFGHMDNMLTLPEFIKYAEFPGGQCFDISSEKTRQLVDDMLKELCDAFSSDMFHLVCDESFDYSLWNSKEYVKKNGKQEVLGEWYLYLVSVVKKYGKKVAGFAHDIIIHYPKTMEIVKDDVPLIHFWSYSDKKKYKPISKLIKKGFEVAAVPTTFDWSRHYPYSDYAEKNTIYMGKDALERGAGFLITTKFGDLFNENLRENIRYGLAIEAQAAWNVNSPMTWNEKGKLDCTNLKKAFAGYYFDTEDLRIIKCMDILSKQNDVLPSFPNGMMNRYWIDPYSREITKKEYKYQQRFVDESAAVLAILNDLKKSNVIKKNIEHLDYIEFAARMALHFGVKILSAEAAWTENYTLVSKLPSTLNDLMSVKLIPKSEIPESKISDYHGLKPLFQWLSTDIMDQKEVYQKLWLKLAVPEGLEYPTHRFEVLNWYYENSIKDLSENKKPSDNQLRSEWIWKAGKRTRWDWGNRCPNYFYTKFQSDKNIKRAIIQGIANNYMDIFLNGDKMGSVMSRFSMSQLPMAKAVQWLDVTDKIQNGDNVISIEGWNYPNGIGGINVLIHLEFEDGTSKDIISDSNWKYRSQAPKQWPVTLESVNSEETWENARSFGRPPMAWNGPISRPNWEKDWHSEISFSFGLRNYVETSIVSFVGDGPFKALFWLVPLGTKIMGTDMHCFRTI